jgi:hypothetical protein
MHKIWSVSADWAADLSFRIGLAQNLGDQRQLPDESPVRLVERMSAWSDCLVTSQDSGVRQRIQAHASATRTATNGAPAGPRLSPDRPLLWDSSASVPVRFRPHSFP